MAVRITTQYIENYDLDSVSPEGYWKFKGGNNISLQVTTTALLMQ